MIGKIDLNDVLIARNRTRVQHKVYLYEAMINMLKKYGSVSDSIMAICACYLERSGCDVSFLKERDRLKMKEMHRAISHNQ